MFYIYISFIYIFGQLFLSFEIQRSEKNNVFLASKFKIILLLDAIKHFVI